MFEKLKDALGRFLHQRNIQIENRSANTGSFDNVFDASLKNSDPVADAVRRAILRQGESRQVPNVVTVGKASAREHGKQSDKGSHQRYLQDGWLED